MNGLIKAESAVSLFGINARANNVIGDTSTGRILNQGIVASRQYREGGKTYRIRLQLRFDDNCHNGHESFSVTADIDSHISGNRWRNESCGCLHDDIAKRFPEVAHLIKWHLVSTDAPMHYKANALYHAGNLDCHGLAAGEPSSFNHYAYFGDSPVGHKVRKSFLTFLQSRMFFEPIGKRYHVTPTTGEFQVCAIAHREAGEQGAYQYDQKYTLVGYGNVWHECPFDTESEAQEFCKALNSCAVRFKANPTAFSSGKARELDHARSAAVWPDATDEQLSLPRDQLAALLDARLPELMSAFKADMLACGFIYPEVHAVPAA